MPIPQTNYGYFQVSTAHLGCMAPNPIGAAEFVSLGNPLGADEGTDAWYYAQLLNMGIPESQVVTAQEQGQLAATWMRVKGVVDQQSGFKQLLDMGVPEEQVMTVSAQGHNLADVAATLRQQGGLVPSGPDNTFNDVMSVINQIGRGAANILNPQPQQQTSWLTTGAIAAGGAVALWMLWRWMR